MPKQSKPDVTLAKINRLWEEASDERKRYDWKWYLYGLWTRGYHYARYDARTKQVIGTPPKDGRPQVTVNKIYPTLRSVRNYTLRNQPKAEVTPENLSEDSLNQALLGTKFLDFIHESEKLRPKLKGSVFQALETSSAWWQVVWNGEKIEINPIDVFDFYPDPKANKPEDMRYGVLALRRRVKDLLEDDKYDKKEVEKIKPDNKTSASSYKEMLLSYEKSEASSGTKNDDNGTVIIKEFWYKEDDKIYVCTEASGRLIRKPEEVDTKIIPFFKLSADIMPFSMFGEGWVKNMIDPQKLLNSAMSSIAEYNLMMNKVKVVTDKGAGVRVYNNQHGQIIEKKRGYDLTTSTSAPLNSAIFQQIDLANMFIEDIGSMHDAMRGRVPVGAKSGRAIEALQVGDSNNMSELVENIEDFLEDVYEYVLWLASQKYQDMRDIIVTDYTSQKQFLKVIGEAAPAAQVMLESGEIPDNTLIVSEKNMVDVKISSYLAHSPEAKREAVKELFGMIPDLPVDIILDAFGTGNIAEVVKRIKQKQEEDRQAEMAQQQEQMSMEQEAQAPQSSGAQEAAAALRTIIEGGAPQVPARAGEEYVSAIDQFLQREQQMGELDPETLQTIQTFRDQIVQGVGR